MASGLEAGAVAVLKRAVELDQDHRWTEAMISYQNGLQLLMDVLKDMPGGKKRDAFRQKAGDYMDRAERLKRLIEDEKRRGQYREQIHIEANSTGHGYESLFGRFLDATVSEVTVEDPYIRATYQCNNFVRLCELLVRRCDNLRRIRLTTSADSSDGPGQRSRLTELTRSLSNSGVTLEVNYSATLHDREIRLNNGWVVKIGRGLSYFHRPVGSFSLGANDIDLRACMETTVDIFHSNSIQS